MTDQQAIQEAVDAFHNLSGDDLAHLEALNTKIQNHEGTWGVSKGGDKTPSGIIQMPWVENDPLIGELIDFMATMDLLPVFSWTKWDESSELFTSENPIKYDDIDLETALKLIYTATRKERFADGTLAWAFESGGFPKLVKRLMEIQEV